jgi:HlyD family secretion protein
MNVGQGDVVRSGQILAELDPTITTADAEQLRNRVAAHDAQIARLVAELAGMVYEPPANASVDAFSQGLLAAQRAVAHAARLRDYDAQVAHAEATLAAAINEGDVQGRRLAGLEEIEDMRSALAETGNGTQLAYLQARDARLDTQAILVRIHGQQAEARQLLRQLQAQRQNYIEEHRRLALEELVEAQDERAVAAEELKKAQLRKAMVNMVAPADAAVLEVAPRSIGSVVQAAEPLFTLVPLNVQLEAEVTVAAQDIGHIGTGDPARIKFDAFPFQKHGTLEGRVVSISEDSFARENAAISSDTVFYEVRLAVGQADLRNLPEDFRLLPGMTVSAEINAGKRSVISYFLYPLIRALDEGLREP